MGVTKARCVLFTLGMLLLGSLVVVDAVWAQGGVLFIARRISGLERFLCQSPWATSMAMASRMWRRRITLPAPCRSCWARRWHF